MKIYRVSYSGHTASDPDAVIAGSGEPFDYGYSYHPSKREASSYRYQFMQREGGNDPSCDIDEYSFAVSKKGILLALQQLASHGPDGYLGRESC